MVDIKKSLGSTRIIIRHLPSCWPVMSEELSQFVLSLSPREWIWRVPARHSPNPTIIPAEVIVWLLRAEPTRAQVEGLPCLPHYHDLLMQQERQQDSQEAPTYLGIGDLTETCNYSGEHHRRPVQARLPEQRQERGLVQQEQLLRLGKPRREWL